MNPHVGDVHPGILCYLHWMRGWPPMYACMADMPLMTGLVFEYMLNSHDEYLQKLATGDYNAAKDEAIASLKQMQTLLADGSNPKPA